MDPADLAIKLGSALEEAGIPYAIGGALAYGYWGVPRATGDVDINIFLEPGNFEPALSALEVAGASFDRAEALQTIIERGDARGSFDGVRIDLFANSIPFHLSAQKRTVRVELDGHHLNILSAEDLLVCKMLFYRAKDKLDVERVISLRGKEIDAGYVRNWLVDTVGDDDRRVRDWDELMGRYE